MAGKRGTKSLADMAVVHVTGARLQPDEDILTKRQMSLWQKIVDSLPADFFRPGDVPLLAAYCKAWDFYLQACAEIEANGVTIEDASGKRYANPAQSLVVTQASAMAQLAVKLRLSPSSRISAKTTGVKSDQPTGNRPWQTGS